MTSPLRIGVALPHVVSAVPGEPLRWEPLRDLAVRLEEAGFDSLWVSDHYFVEGPAGPRPQLDALVALPALATATARVTLGTLVLAVGFRRPSVLAKAAASLDRLSGGRFVLGLGAGWLEDEYRAAGLPFPHGSERLAELEEAVQLIRAMLTHETADFAGDRFTVRSAPNLPQPVPSDPPILIAAGGPQALRTVARTADVWNVAWRFSPADYAVKMRALEEASEEVGRDPGRIGRSVGLLTLVGENRADLEQRFDAWRGYAPWQVGDASLDDLTERGLVGTVEQVVERMEALRALGMTELVMNFAPLPFGWSSGAGWDIVAERILPLYREAPR